MDCTSAIERKVPAALSDPVCDRQHYRTMADAFLREHPNALFVQVRPAAAERAGVGRLQGWLIWGDTAGRLVAHRVLSTG